MVLCARGVGWDLLREYARSGGAPKPAMVRSADDRWVSWSLAETRFSRPHPTPRPDIQLVRGRAFQLSLKPPPRTHSGVGQIAREDRPRLRARALASVDGTVCRSRVSRICVGGCEGVLGGGVSRSERLADSEPYDHTGRGSMRVSEQPPERIPSHPPARDLSKRSARLHMSCAHQSTVALATLAHSSTG